MKLLSFIVASADHNLPREGKRSISRNMFTSLHHDISSAKLIELSRVAVAGSSNMPSPEGASTIASPVCERTK